MRFSPDQQTRRGGGSRPAACLALALALLAGGCGGDQLRREDERRSTPLIQGHLRTTAAVSELDRGHTVTLPPGGTLAVRLEQCAGCPFVWVQAEKLDAGVVTLVGEVIERDPAIPEGSAGSGGIDVFVFKGVKPGEQILRFFYSDGRKSIDKEADYRVVVR